MRDICKVKSFKIGKEESSSAASPAHPSIICELNSVYLGRYKWSWCLSLQLTLSEAIICPKHAAALSCGGLDHWNFSGLALTENPKATSDFFPFLSHSECWQCLLLQQHIWALGSLGQAKGPLSPGFGCSCVTVSVAAVTLAVTPCSACLALMDNTQHTLWGAQKEMSLSSSHLSKKGWTSGFCTIEK